MPFVETRCFLHCKEGTCIPRRSAAPAPTCGGQRLTAPGLTQFTAQSLDACLISRDTELARIRNLRLVNPFLAD